MKKIIVLLILFIVTVTNFLMAQQPSPVKVADGMLQGIYENGLTVYKGIPFAAPPVGDLRWKAPQPAAKWEGMRMADKFAPGAMQGINPPSGKAKTAYTSMFGHRQNPTTKNYLYWYGSMVEVLPLVILLIQCTMEQTWQRKASSWLALHTVLGNSVF